MAEEAGGCTDGAAARATSALLPVPLPVPVPGIAGVLLLSSFAFSTSAFLSLALLFSLCPSAVLLRESLDGLLLPGLNDCDDVAPGLRAPGVGKLGSIAALRSDTRYTKYPRISVRGRSAESS